MSLDLSSLKNISTKPDSNPSESDRAEVLPAKTPLITLEKKTEIKNPIMPPQEPKSIATPKISLMKLKKASGIETPSLPEKEAGEVESVTNVTVMEEKPEKDETIPLATKQEEQEEIISLWKQKDAPISSGEVLITEEVICSSKKPESILTIEASLPTGKEFFPNLQVSGKLDLEEDLLDLGEPLHINKIAEPVASEESTLPLPSENTQMEEIEVAQVSPQEEVLPVQEETSKIETPTAPSEEVSIEEIVVIDVPKETSQKEIIQDITPEHVAEVKAELSEGRRAGFRFFMQKKTKIIAGAGVVLLSLSAIAFFSSSFFLSDVEKSGKSNVQEIKENVQTEIITEKPVETDPITPPSTIETPVAGTSYEMGRDYSITKNTKKNIRKNIVPDSLTGTTVPTP